MRKKRKNPWKTLKLTNSQLFALKWCVEDRLHKNDREIASKEHLTKAQERILASLRKQGFQV